MMKPAVTVQYPHEREDPPPRARGVIALKEENCTVCMLCARRAPTGASTSRVTRRQRPPRREGGRPRSVSVLDRFDIDYALCMYCGICVEVCPFDALFWSPEFEYSEPRIADLLHDKDKLGEWMETVPEPEPLEIGAEERARSRWSRENIVFGIFAAAMVLGALGVVTTKNVVHAALFLVVVLAGGAAQFILLGQEFVAWVQVLVYIGAVIVLFLFGIMLTRAPMHPDESPRQRPAVAGRGRRRSFLGGILARAARSTRSTTTRSSSKRRLAPPRSRTRSSAPTSSRSRSSACCCSPR